MANLRRLSRVRRDLTALIAWQYRQWRQDPHDSFAAHERRLILRMALHGHTLRLTEGHISRAQARDLQRIVRERERTDGCARMGEFGMNAGQSALTMMLACPQALMTSFDTCEHPYVRYAAACLRRRRRHRGRHELVVGRSQETAPQYALDHPERRFDVILVDGLHYGDGPWGDILAALQLLVRGGLIIMDDVVEEPGDQAWCLAPTMAWNKAVEQGLVTETSRQVYPAASPGDHIRGFAVGIVP
jgi:predicted O-methyltransferase YrrM